MTVADGVTLPLWLVAAGAVLAVWSIIDRMLVPSVRWFVRRRLNRVIEDLNTRLQFQIPRLARTRRQVLIDRLTYDPEVLEAVDQQASTAGTPRDVLLAEAARYAREIVPSFNAYAYFRVGHYVARQVIRLLYRVRLGSTNEDALSAIDPKSSIVFVINHRSNMDYLILAYMVANRSALSYAVGEWARIWPLQTLIRTLGAYFVRRGSGNALYRKVLARYVQFATAGGVAQAVFPEGGLSRDGCLRTPKLGLIKYMVSEFDPDGERDLVFVPVGINYDRVLEDRSLIRTLDPDAVRRSRGFIVRTLLTWVGHNVWLMLGGRWYRFGYACLNFGQPLSMRAYVRDHDIEFGSGDAGAREEALRALGARLLEAVARCIPVTPVAIVATVFAENPTKAMSELEIKARAQRLIEALERRQAYVHVPRADRDYAVTVGLRMLTLRHLVTMSERLYRASDGASGLLAYYANSIEHFVPGDSRRHAGG